MLVLVLAKDGIEQRQHLKGLLESHEISQMFRFRYHMLGSLGGGGGALCVAQL